MECILCNNKNFKIVANKLRYNIPRKVVRCENCSLVSLENPTDDTINYSESEYRTLHSPVLGKLVTPQEMFDIYLPFQKARIERVKSLLDSKAHILEIGCSTGHFLYSIKERVSKVIGIELYHDHAQFAREHCGIEVHEKSLDENSFSSKCFDVIFMFQVFEHIPDPLKLLSLCKKYLKPTGTIYLEVPNLDDVLLSTYEIPTYRDFYYRAPHVYYYSQSTLTKLLRKAGFSGTTKTVQEYTIFNHIHWLLAGKPQPNQTEAYSEPIWTCTNPNRKKHEEIIKCWFSKINEEYKNLLEKEGIAEHVCYKGNPVS